MADFFPVRTASLFTLRTFGAQINWRVISRKALFAPHSFLSNKSHIHFAGESGNRNTFLESMANGMFKMKMDIDRHGHRLMPNNCKNLNPPYLSSPITLNLQLSLGEAHVLYLKKWKRYTLKKLYILLWLLFDVAKRDSFPRYIDIRTFFYYAKQGYILRLSSKPAGR